MEKCLLIAAVLLFLAAACSPKIIGARPHRKDRNCGCEYRAAGQPTDSLVVCYDW